VVLPHHGCHAQASQFFHGGRGPLWIGCGVADHQLERPSADTASVVDVADGQLDSSEQLLAGLDPAGPSERDQSADLHG
jgi:hypothetical protein